jgi:hypothetical protein
MINTHKLGHTIHTLTGGYTASFIQRPYYLLDRNLSLVIVSVLLVLVKVCLTSGFRATIMLQYTCVPMSAS